MPTAFHPWTLRRLPEGDRFGADAQFYLGLSHHEAPEEAHTTVAREAVNYRDGVDRYLCEHDYLTKLKYPGRSRGHIFTEFVSPYRFTAYVVREPDGTQPTFWVRTKDSVATDFVNRLNTLPEFNAIERRVDFDRLRPRLQMIKGAWFGEMRAANLSSTAVFGTRVDRSAEFRRAEQQGRLHTLNIHHTHNGIDYLLMVTTSGVVVTYHSFDTEEDELDVVMDFKRNHLDACWSM